MNTTNLGDFFVTSRVQCRAQEKRNEAAGGLGKGLAGAFAPEKPQRCGFARTPVWVPGEAGALTIIDHARRATATFPRRSA
jgi:hypothetical protein